MRTNTGSFSCAFIISLLISYAAGTEHLCHQTNLKNDSRPLGVMDEQILLQVEKNDGATQVSGNSLIIESLSEATKSYSPLETSSFFTFTFPLAFSCDPYGWTDQM